MTARSKVKIKVRNHKDGSATVTGTVDPKLPGRDPVAALERRQAVRPHHHPQQRQLHAASQEAEARPLPGRVHPLRRARRALRIQHRSHPMKLSRSLPRHPRRPRSCPRRRSAHPALLHTSRRRAAQRDRAAGPARPGASGDPHAVCGRQRRLRDGLHRGTTTDAGAASEHNARRPARGATPMTRGGVNAHCARAACADQTCRRTRRARARRSTRREHPRLAGQDPFFNYIPWQSTSVGIGDVPSEWIAVVKRPRPESTSLA